MEQASYSRIRMENTDFHNLDAAEWEFTYSKSNVPLHNIDLGVVTGKRSFALNFETPSAADRKATSMFASRPCNSMTLGGR